MPDMDSFSAGLLLGLLFGVGVGLLAARAMGRSTAAADRAADRAAATEQFAALSDAALSRAQQQLLGLAEQRLAVQQTAASAELERRQVAVQHLVQPLSDTLTRLELSVSAAEQARAESFGRLTQALTEIGAGQADLGRRTAALVGALRSPNARGAWGEMQLRRVVESAGMTEHVDFDTQVHTADIDGALRPDLVVHLSGGGSVVVDAKTPLAAYLSAMETDDDVERARLLTEHARALRGHVMALAAKSYWQRMAPSPEFVVMFVPGEAFLGPALQADPALLQDAMDKRVLLATPTSLIALLRTTAYSWQQAALARNAAEVLALGRQLHERLQKLVDSVSGVGRSLETTVRKYNEAVASMESRVLVTARRMTELRVSDQELTSVEPVAVAVRRLAADVALTADVEPADVEPAAVESSGPAPLGVASGGSQAAAEVAPTVVPCSP